MNMEFQLGILKYACEFLSSPFWKHRMLMFNSSIISINQEPIWYGQTISDITKSTNAYVGDFQNNGITLELKIVTFHENHSYTLEHYYLL